MVTNEVSKSSCESDVASLFSQNTCVRSTVGETPLWSNGECLLKVCMDGDYIGVASWSFGVIVLIMLIDTSIDIVIFFLIS